MRSELVTAAVGQVPNRYLLVHVTTRLTRAFHRAGNAREQQSINDALSGLGDEKYLVVDGRLIVAGLVDQFEVGGGCGVCMVEGQHSQPCSCMCHAPEIAAEYLMPLNPAPAETSEAVETA